MESPSNWLRRLYREAMAEYAAAASESTGSAIAAAAREAMNGVGWEALELDDMPKARREELLKSAHEIFREPALEYVIGGLIREQAKKTVKDGSTEAHYVAGRSMIVGISLVRETVRLMEERFLALGEEESFDKESLI